MIQQIPDIRQDEMTKQDAMDYAKRLKKQYTKHTYKAVKKASE